jgi:hypothetical protein
MTDTSCEKKINSFLIQQILKLQFQYLPWTLISLHSYIFTKNYIPQHKLFEAGKINAL